MNMKYDIYEATKIGSKKILVLIGGTGDTKDGYKRLAELLRIKLPDYTLVTMSFSQMPDTNNLQLQVDDLKGLIKELTQKFDEPQISIMATSMGAYSVCFLLVDPGYAKKVERIIFLDPADYEAEMAGVVTHDSWSGFEKYEPKGRTASDRLREIKGKAKVHVIHLTLKNHGPNGYHQAKFEARGSNEINGFPRLNSEMVKSFYNKLPTKNQGSYLEVNNIPHGFVRDGNIPINEERVATLIAKVLK